MRITGQAAQTCGKATAVYNYTDTATWQETAEWALCGTGTMQSPIDIPGTGNPILPGAPGLAVTIQSVSPALRENNGHAIEVVGNFANLTTSDQADPLQFAGAQLHFHSPSENTVGGVSYPLEMHIVLKEFNQTPGDITGGIAVISVLFTSEDTTADNPCLSGVFSPTPPEPGCEDEIDDMDLQCLDSVLKGDWWSFSGSLTTPPCTEGVEWKVMKTFATISTAQLAAFTDKYTGNNRPTQVLGSRIVSENDASATATAAPTTAAPTTAAPTTAAPTTAAPTTAAPTAAPSPPVVTTAEPSVTTAEPSPTSDNTLLYAGIGSTVVILIGVGVFMQSSAEPTPEEEGAEMTEPPPEEAPAEEE